MKYFRPGETKPATIAETLQLYNNSELTPIVRQACEGKPPTRKDDLVATLLRLIEGDGLRLTFQKLDEREKAAVAETIWSADATFDEARFEAKYGPGPETKTDEPAGQYNLAHSARKGQHSLLKLLMPEDFVPRDLQMRLREFVPKPAAAKLTTLDSPPEHVEMADHVWNSTTKKYDRIIEPVPVVRRDMERTAAHNLLAMLRLVDAGKIGITDKNRWPTPAAIRQAAAVLDGGDYYADEDAADKKEKMAWDYEEKPGPICAFAWPLLLQAGKLTQVRGQKLELSKAGRAALIAPPHETLAVLWEKWLSSDTLDELRRINIIRGQTGNGQQYLTEPSQRRSEIADALSECPVSQWIAVDEFSRYMQAAGHQFDVSEDSWSLYIGEHHYGSLQDDWDILELRYMMCFLMEYAATLGVIDVAFLPPAGARPDFGHLWGTDDLSFLSRYDGLCYLRLNALGAFCLNLNKTYSPPPTEVRHILNVLPNLDVVAVAPLSPADRMLLDAFAVKTGDHVWQLERSRILSAVAEGRNIQELAAYLDASSGKQMPQTVVEFFDHIRDRSVALSDLGPARMVRCADATLAALIANDSAAGRCCSLAGGDMLVVPAKDEAGFHRAILKLGYVLAKPTAKV